MRKMLCLAVLAVSLTACRGGGGSGEPLTLGDGTFLDRSEFRTDTRVPAMGTATYTGFASGEYLANAGTDLRTTVGNLQYGEYDGRARLTADFDLMGLFGLIDHIYLKNIRDIPHGENEALPPIPGPHLSEHSITLHPVPITQAGAFSGGDVTFNSTRLDIISSDGNFEGKFSNVNDHEGHPRAVAGVHEVSLETAGGSTATFNGMFYGVTTD